MISFRKVGVGQYYFFSNNVHLKNVKIYFALLEKAEDNVVQQVVHGAIREWKRKIMQFQGILWLLIQGQPLIQYESCSSFCWC